MAASAEVLPAGNEWQFSERNYPIELQPGPGRREITQPTGLLLDVATHVQERFIVEGWQFAAFVQNLPPSGDNSHHLIAIFTHPSRTTLLSIWNHDNRKFIKPEVAARYHGKQYFELKVDLNDPINEILSRGRGTNFVADAVEAKHSGIKIRDRSFWQTGVGMFDISLSTIEQSISQFDARIEVLMEKVRPLQEQRATLLALQSPNPVSLFQTE